MNFRAQKHRLSSDLVDEMIDDMIQVSINAQHKDDFRNQLIYKKFSNHQNPNLMSNSQIEYLERKLTSDEVSDYKLAQSLKRISRQLDKHMKTLVNMFNKLTEE